MDSDKLSKKLIELREALKKGMSQGGLGGAGSVKAGAVLPSINKLPKPGNNSLAGKTGIPGMKQPSIKNPVKAAEQIQNKDIKDIKMKEAQAALKTPQMTKEEFPFKNAHSHEEKAKQLNQAYDKHKTLFNNATDPTDKKYHSGNLDRIQAKMQQHAQLKKEEVVKFDSKGQWSIEKMEPIAGMGYDDAPDSIIDGTTVNQVEDRGSDVNVASVERPGASIKKSGYKGYSEADNVKRKAKNLGEDTDMKSMPRIKEYGGSGPSAASKMAAEAKSASAKNEVTWTHKHPETGEMVSVTKTPRKMKNYQKKIKAQSNKGS